MARRRSILLVMHQWSGYLAGVQLGISQYITHRPEWIWTRIVPVPSQLRSLSAIRADGAIAYVEEEYEQTLRSLGIPVVEVSNWRPTQSFARVLPDDLATGRMAADYLLELGLQSFGVIGTPAAFSDLRQQAFVERVAQQQCAVSVFGAHTPRTSRSRVPAGVSIELAHWLRSLPKPAGIFGTFDSAAAGVIEACRLLQIKVPDEISVLGVDNDELISNFTHPPLSSIELQTRRIGVEAARLLDRLMAGEPAPAAPILFAPERVVARQSTNTLAVPDEDVAAAVRYIREHVRDGITVRDVLRKVPVNRRYLERKFRQFIGRSPLQEIRLSRLRTARDLLARTDLPISTVASRSGFPNQERFAVVFRAAFSMPPSAYRRSHRADPP